MKLGESIFQGLIYLTLFCFPPRKLTKCFIRILGGSFINNPASSCFTLFALYNFKGTVCLFFRVSVNPFVTQLLMTFIPKGSKNQNQIYSLLKDKETKKFFSLDLSEFPLMFEKNANLMRTSPPSPNWYIAAKSGYIWGHCRMRQVFRFCILISSWGFEFAMCETGFCKMKCIVAVQWRGAKTEVCFSILYSAVYLFIGLNLIRLNLWQLMRSCELWLGQCQLFNY